MKWQIKQKVNKKKKGDCQKKEKFNDYFKSTS